MQKKFLLLYFLLAIPLDVVHKAPTVALLKQNFRALMPSFIY